MNESGSRRCAFMIFFGHMIRKSSVYPNQVKCRKESLGEYSGKYYSSSSLGALLLAIQLDFSRIVVVQTSVATFFSFCSVLFLVFPPFSIINTVRVGVACGTALPPSVAVHEDKGALLRSVTTTLPFLVISGDEKAATTISRLISGSNFVVF